MASYIATDRRTSVPAFANWFRFQGLDASKGALTAEALSQSYPCTRLSDLRPSVRASATAGMKNRRPGGPARGLSRRHLPSFQHFRPQSAVQQFDAPRRPLAQRNNATPQFQCRRVCFRRPYGNDQPRLTSTRNPEAALALSGQNGSA